MKKVAHSQARSLERERNPSIQLSSFSVDETFDPYRKWLGIPPEEQPPHHYRLLGLELFEENPDVIVNAADARLTFLQTFVRDEHADMAGRISTQIKEVQLCLLDPAKKAFYDGQLQRRIAALKKNAQTMATTSAGPVSPTILQEKWTDLPVPPQPPAPKGTSNTPPSATPAAFSIPSLPPPLYSKRSTSSSLKRWQILAAMTLGLVATGCLLVFLLVKYRKSEENASTTVAQTALRVTEKPRETKPTSSTQQTKPKVSKTPETEANPSGIGEKTPRRENGTSPIDMKPEHNSDPSNTPNENASNDHRPENPFENPMFIDENPTPSKDPESDASAEEEINLAVQDNHDVPSMQDKPQPIPDREARQAAEKSVREIYGPKFAAAKKPFEKNALAGQLWNEALTRRDAARRFVLMSLACQLAADSGQLPQAMLCADRFAKFFEVDLWELKSQAIAKVAKAAFAAQSARVNPQKFDSYEIVLIGRQFADEAKQAGHIEVAQKIVKAITPLAKKDPLLIRDVNTFGREVEKLAARYQPVRKALDSLKTEPDNAEANALAGRWLCFESRQWDKGLPMLAKSSDEALSCLAVADIATIKTAAAQLATADAWWDFAQKEKGTVKAGSLARAEYWYQRALPNLDGLNEAKANERINLIAGIDVSPASGRGAIATGNVALAVNGTLVEGVRANADKLLDGNSQNPGWDGAAASGPVPCEWTIIFDKVYQLQQIRFHFYDGDARFYRYIMSASADGVNYKPVFDRTQGQSFKWQLIPLGGQPVKSVKIFGTFSYKNHPFSVTEFEAYCIPPKP